jgi:cytochrome c553
MQNFIRRYPARVHLTVLTLGLIMLAGLAWSMSATAEPQRRRIPPGPKRNVNYSRFKHSSHSSNCASCHRVKEGARVTNFPGHNACNSCHFIPAFTVGARAFCIVCHTPPGNTARMKSFPEQKPDQFSIKFPHNVHVGMEVKDYNPIVEVKEVSEEEKKIQAIAVKGGCISCHEKDGKAKKEKDFSKPFHAECAQCHGKDGKKVAPAMDNCVGCHIAPAKRSILSGLFADFRHDKDHERDIRPEAKSKAMIDCKFCHKGAVKAKTLADIKPPEESACIACHNEQVGAHSLKPQELAKLTPSPAAKTPAATKPVSEKTKPETKPADKKETPSAKPAEDKPPAAKPAETSKPPEPPKQRR